MLSCCTCADIQDVLHSFRIDKKESVVLNLAIFRRVCKIAESDIFVKSVCPSVSMERLRSYGTDFHDI
jgi:hypothetical protein